MTETTTILVYADWKGLAGPLLVGELRAQYLRNKEVFDFTYSNDWVRSSHNLLIDPDLGLLSGPQYVPPGRTNFGVFLDSSPDRWGRTLMQRRSSKRLNEVDFLLGVHDASRLGGLRFKARDDGSFLDDSPENAAPPWTSLRELEWCSLQLESPDLQHDEYHHLLKLLAPGSSLGGARPKASVVDENGELWIAKFPSRQDTYDVGAWEYVANTMASQCGIDVPKMKIAQFGSDHHTVLSKRFDREKEGKRIHAASAMTMLRRVDGEDHQSEVSYLDLVPVILQNSNMVARDLEQLWRRILFNVLISNTDDHLRNHMFLLSGTQGTWSLAPAYDLNPVPFGTGLSLNIDEVDNSLDPKLVAKIAPYFRLQPATVAEITDQIRDVVATWELIANNAGLSRREVLQMRRAFHSM